jgi:hypothetical protein
LDSVIPGDLDIEDDGSLSVAPPLAAAPQGTTASPAVSTRAALAADTPLLTASFVPPISATGLAARYPNDVGIENHPAVVFADGFEGGKTKFDNVFGATFTRTAQNVHGGTTAMELAISWPRPTAVSRGVHRHFQQGFDILYLRYYAKYEATADLYHGGTHNGASIAARAPGVPDAIPGIYADGRTHFTVLLDTWRPKTQQIVSPGHLAMYVYHPEQQHQWGEHFFPSGRLLPWVAGRTAASLFGPTFVPRPDMIPQRNRWYCYEMMVKANTPGKRDGRLAFWVDGQLVGDFPNLRLRDVSTLKSNRIGFNLYTQNPLIKSPVKMWVDDVVAATSYIGPKRKR